MESQLNYFRASNPGERVPAELAATGFFGMRVLAVAQGGFRAGSEDSADPEETAAEAVEESTGEFLEVLLQERIRVKDEPHGALPFGYWSWAIRCLWRRLRRPCRLMCTGCFSTVLSCLAR